MRLCTGVGKDLKGGGHRPLTSVQLKCVWSTLETCLGDKEILGGGGGGGGGRGHMPPVPYPILWCNLLRGLHKRGGLIHMAERWRPM